MKTFEERYTAWIDGELEGSTLMAFEQELTRRAAAGEAVRDKSDTSRLRSLLQDHLQAPALTNPDFFNHQLRELIDAETAASRGREPNRRADTPFFAWSLARLIGLGAASLFAAAALYYGMMPPHVGSLPNTTVAVNTPAPAADTPAPIPSAAPGEAHPAMGMNQLALRSPTPSPIDLAPDIKTYVPDQPANPTTITPLHYDNANVNVLWLNGLDHVPGLPAANGDAPSPVPAPTNGANP